MYTYVDGCLCMMPSLWYYLATCLTGLNRKDYTVITCCCFPGAPADPDELAEEMKRRGLLMAKNGEYLELPDILLHAQSKQLNVQLFMYQEGSLKGR